MSFWCFFSLGFMWILPPYLANTFLLWKIQNRIVAASVEVDGCAWSSSIWRLHLSLPNQVFVDKTNSRRGNQKIEKQTSSILSFRCSNVTGDSLKNHTTLLIWYHSSLVNSSDEVYQSQLKVFQGSTIWTRASKFVSTITLSVWPQHTNFRYWKVCLFSSHFPSPSKCGFSILDTFHIWIRNLETRVYERWSFA